MFDIDKDRGMTLSEIADGVTVDQVKAATGCKLNIASDLKPMQQA